MTFSKITLDKLLYSFIILLNLSIQNVNFSDLNVFRFVCIYNQNKKLIYIDNMFYKQYNQYIVGTYKVVSNFLITRYNQINKTWLKIISMSRVQMEKIKLDS